MYKLKILILFLINFTLFAKSPESLHSANNEESLSQSVNKPVLSFNKVIDMADMLIEDSWTNFSKIKSFVKNHLGGIKDYNDIMIKISEIPFLQDGRDAKLKIYTTGNLKNEIISYYISFSITMKELEEFNKFWKANEYNFTYGNLKVKPWLLNEIGMVDLTGIKRYSSIKRNAPGTNNFIFYPPYLYVLTENFDNENRYNIYFLVSGIDNSVEIEKVNVESRQQDFHKNVRRIVDAVKDGKIRNPEFAGDEIKKFYPKTVLGDAYWDSFSSKRFISKIQLAGTSQSFITGYTYYGLIGRGEKSYFSSEMTKWVDYLSYALGKNYVAVKKYDSSNFLTSVLFAPVNHDFNASKKIVIIKLATKTNVFIEDGIEELLLKVFTPTFEFSHYDMLWDPIKSAELDFLSP